MLERTTASPHYAQMIRSIEPLQDHFGINHFWYFRITYSGHFCYLGSHAQWNEFFCENKLIDAFPFLRHPDILKPGVYLMQNASNERVRQLLEIARERFNIHFGVQLIKKAPEGIEGYGFATPYDYLKATELLINDLGVLSYFIKYFRETNKKLLALLHANQIDLASYLGPVFREKPTPFPYPKDRDVFLKKIGLKEVLSLSERETEVLAYLASGYPASYIAGQIHLATRTVENYIAALKEKLYCDSKVKLIQKAKALTGFAYNE